MAPSARSWPAIVAASSPASTPAASPAGRPVPSRARPPRASSAAATLASLAEAAAHCRDCPLWQGATQTVWGEGPPRARVMLVGEQPGDKEDLAGHPFIGPAGQLLDKALASLGWPRETVYVTNAVKHFKYQLRGKRRMHKTPAQREALACQHWLDDELATVQPELVVALGGTAARSLLGHEVAVMKQRGQWLVRQDGLPVLVTLHPSALLRWRGEDRALAYEAWLEDLRHVQQRLGSATRA